MNQPGYCVSCERPTMGHCERCGLQICRRCSSEHWDSLDQETRKPCISLRRRRTIVRHNTPKVLRDVRARLQILHTADLHAAKELGKLVALIDAALSEETAKLPR